MAGILAQKQQAMQKKTEQQKKGKATQLPPSVQALSPDELKKFLALAFVKYMHGTLGFKNKSTKPIFSEASLKNRVEALKDSSRIVRDEDVPQVQSKKVYAP